MVRMTIDKTESDVYDDDDSDDNDHSDDNDDDELKFRERTVSYVYELNLDLDVQGDNCFLVLTARQSKSGANAFTRFTTSKGVSPPSWEQVSLGTDLGSPKLLKKWTYARGAGHAIVCPTWCPYQ